MVRGGGKRCWEIHPLTSSAHSVILSVLPLYFCGFYERMRAKGKDQHKDREREQEGNGEYVGVLAGWQQQPMCLEPILHNLPAYFRALMQYCFPVFCWCLLPLSPIFCLIVIHVQSVCLANLLVFRPSQLTPCLCVTECILHYLLYYLHRFGDSILYLKCCRISLQAQGFHSSLRCKTAQTIKGWNNKPFQEISQLHNCFLYFASVGGCFYVSV